MAAALTNRESPRDRGFSLRAAGNALQPNASTAPISSRNTPRPVAIELHSEDEPHRWHLVLSNGRIVRLTARELLSFGRLKAASSRTRSPSCTTASGTG